MTEITDRPKAESLDFKGGAALGRGPLAGRSRTGRAAWGAVAIFGLAGLALLAAIGEQRLVRESPQAVPPAASIATAAPAAARAGQVAAVPDRAGAGLVPGVASRPHPPTVQTATLGSGPAAGGSAPATVAPPPPPPVSAAVAVPPQARFAGLAARLLPGVVNISTTQTVKPDADRDPGSDEPAPPGLEPGLESEPRSQPEADTSPGSPFDEFFKDFMDHQSGGNETPRPKPAEKSVALGSGFVIDAAGLVVTNNHVVDDADEITVILQDNTELKAQLVGRDALTDLALLRVKTSHKLTALAWGDSDAERVGDWVLAVGNPFGLGGTLTAGLLSGRSRAIGNGGPYDDFLQTDASINRGNSGGPLFDLTGHVIGINAAIFSPSGGSIGLGFAIPSNLARPVIEQFLKYGKARRGWLGIRAAAVDPEMAAVYGVEPGHAVLVGALVPKSPAALGGVRPGDLVLGVNGRSAGDSRKFLRLVDDLPVDGPARIELLRKSERATVTVTVAEAREEPAAHAAAQPATPAPLTGTVNVLGFGLAQASPELREKYQLEDDAPAVVVSVTHGGATVGRDLQPGDVIVEAAERPVKSPADVAARIEAARRGGRRTVFLLVQRKGDLRYVGIRIDRGVG